MTIKSWNDFKEVSEKKNSKRSRKKAEKKAQKEKIEQIQTEEGVVTLQSANKSEIKDIFSQLIKEA